MCPNAGKIVSHDLHAHRELVVLGCGKPVLGLPQLAFDTKLLVNVVAHLMGDHIGLGEIAGCSELLPQPALESEVDVHLLIVGAIKRSHGGLGIKFRRQLAPPAVVLRPARRCGRRCR